MAMMKDELVMLKATSLKVDADHTAVVTYQYHSEKTDDGKQNRPKSFYRWFAKVLPNSEWKAKIDYMFDDEHRLEKFKIPNDSSGLYLCMGKSSTHYDVATWLDRKIRKAMTWEDGLKQLNGFKTKTPNRAEGVNANAAYDLVGYTAENGDVVDITNKEDLLKHLGQNLIKYIPKKS